MLAYLYCWDEDGYSTEMRFWLAEDQGAWKVADWEDPMPELCGEGPLGLQLHSNKVAQEVHFRGLILSENPEDRLVTLAK